MLNLKIKNLIEKEKTKGQFLSPFYEKYCFSNIPPTILSLFGLAPKKPTLPPELFKPVLKGTRPKKIIVFLIDGLGFTSWVNHSKNYELLSLLEKRGQVSPITAVFPTSTTAALTTINTGLLPEEHALFEWHLYLEEIDLVIKSLPFSRVGEEKQDGLLKEGVNPKILFRGKTIYQVLKEAGIASFTFNNKSHAESCYSKLVHQGSERIPFSSLSNLMVILRKILEEEKGPAYFYIYWEGLDSVSHHHGPDSKEYEAELANITSCLKDEFLGKLKKEAVNNTLFILTSDHGEVKITPEKIIFLNKFPEVKENLRVTPTGGPRDVFLHLRPGKLEAAFAFLTKTLKGKAEVLLISEAIKIGLFGKEKPKKKFLKRAGDLLVLPYEDYTVWWEYPNSKLRQFRGHHGGLIPKEVLIPFATAWLSDLL